jgi:DNA-binding response OmpR family regulator
MREPTETAPVLIADADPDRRGFLAANLTADGHRAETAASLTHARQLLGRACPALLVLAPLERPGDALTLLAELRAAHPAVPVDPALAVLCLGPGGDQLAELRALRAGADDWAALPVRYPVLLERVRALLRRTRRRRGRIRVGTLELDPASRSVRIGTSAVELTNYEFCLLARLASEPTRVWAKRELLADLWGYPAAARTRTLDSHACRLRGKLAAAGGERYVVNVWGVGYRLLSPVDAPEHNGSAA